MPRRRNRALALAVAVLLGGAVAAGASPLGAAWREYKRVPGAKAFAINGGRAFGLFYALDDEETARRKALEACEVMRQIEALEGGFAGPCRVVASAPR